MADKIEAPAAPSIAGFSEAQRATWRKTWVKAFEQAIVDHPGDEMTQRAVATREANRIFRVEAPTSHAEAMALEDWKVLHRGVGSGGKLHVVTIDGKKHAFDVPAEEPKKAGAANGAK